MAYCFVVGCARSGTSILGELLASHPDVKYLFEAHTIWEKGGRGINNSHRLTDEHVTPTVKAEIQTWFREQQEDGKLLIEKNPRNILRVPYITKIFPNAKIIHILRDGRDVACSMEPGCGRDHWSHLKPPSWSEYYADFSGALRCAMAWKEIVEIGLKDLEKREHLLIKYEDLVTSPSATAGKICSYLGLGLDQAVIEFAHNIVNRTGSSYHAKYQHHWYEDNHEVRIGRWKENLSFFERRKINKVLKPLLLQLDYSL